MQYIPFTLQGPSLELRKSFKLSESPFHWTLNNIKCVQIEVKILFHIQPLQKKNRIFKNRIDFNTSFSQNTYEK